MDVEDPSPRPEYNRTLVMRILFGTVMTLATVRLKWYMTDTIFPTYTIWWTRSV